MVVGPFPAFLTPASAHGSAGESGLGKTTLINTLFSTELSPAKNYSKRHVKQLDKLVNEDLLNQYIESRYIFPALQGSHTFFVRHHHYSVSTICMRQCWIALSV